ncbi:hypothetical protein GQ42DRAFT_164245, partial [Ramicandelaber brevisporus]
MPTTSLPIELIELIATYCNVQSLLSFRAVNKSCCRIVTKALARIVDTAGPLNRNDQADQGLPLTLLRSLLTSSKYTEDVLGLVVRETPRQVKDMRRFEYIENVPSDYEEADEFLLQHRRLSLISHTDNIVGKAGRQIDSYRPQNDEVRSWLYPPVLSDLPYLTKLCILNNNSAWMPRNLPPEVLERLTWLEIEVDGELVKITDDDLDAIATHCKQLTHLRIVSATLGPPKAVWINFVHQLKPNSFRVLDLICYPHLSTDVWKAIYDTQCKSLRAAVFYKAPELMEFIISKQFSDDGATPFSHNITHLLTVGVIKNSNTGLPDLGSWFPNIRSIQLTAPTSYESRYLEDWPQVESFVHRGRMASTLTCWDFDWIKTRDTQSELGLTMPNYMLKTIHLIWQSDLDCNYIVNLLVLPCLHTLSITQGIYEHKDKDPNPVILEAVDTLKQSDTIKPTTSLRLLRLLFWHNPISTSTVRAIFAQFPRLGSIQLPSSYTPLETVAQLDKEFGHRVCYEIMDFGELDPKHGVLALHFSTFSSGDSGKLFWFCRDDDPKIDKSNYDSDYDDPYYGAPLDGHSESDSDIDEDDED